MSDVKASDRLTDSAVCLVASEHGPDRQFERLLNAAGRLDKAAKPILEINPRHERIVALAKLGKRERAFKEDAAHLLYDEARVLDGDKPVDARAFSERLALQLANRSFWGRGGTGSDEQTPLYRLPAVDRLALEMAANEDIERRALLGELDALHAAWKDAEEIAAIADELFADDVLAEFNRQYNARIAAGDLP